MSGKPVAFHPEALAETEAALAWYRERSSRTAELFLTELEKAIAAISEAPQRWPLFGEGTRRLPLLRFPYSIVYREVGASFEVLAVAHGRRRPGYWARRKTG